jgi:regulation of enolase protein 1 (concanavalin A-like superfamily)
MENDRKAYGEEATESTRSAKHAVHTVPRNRPITEATLRSNGNYASLPDDEMSRLVDNMRYTTSNDYQVGVYTCSHLESSCTVTQCP